LFIYYKVDLRYKYAQLSLFRVEIDPSKIYNPA